MSRSEVTLHLTALVSGLILMSFVATCAGYKHVVFMHGILSGPDEFQFIHDQIQKLHPGTPTTSVNLFNDDHSLTNMWEQVQTVSDSLKSILTNASSEGTILICYSQGGPICRGILSTVQHNVKTFIGLSCPLAGQFGDTDYLKYLFPKYLKDNIYKLFYTKLGQDISVANYWNDPHQQELFKKFSNYLAVLNNQSSVVSPKSNDFKENFLRLSNLVLVGGPDDGVITPWQSSQFGMYNASESVLPMEDQEWYQNDAFGLKTMYTQGRVHVHTIPKVEHVYWYRNQEVFDTCIKPWLT